MDKLKIIIDCDPGIDDAYAIALALRNPNIEVLGIMCVSGNVRVENTTRNAQGITYLLNKKVAIFKGSEAPLVCKPVFAGEIHGRSGLSNYEFDDDKLNPVSKLDVISGYLQLINNCESKITIVAVGPLTNVAILLKAFPKVKDKIEQLIIMGGGIKGGNITEVGEFNFYVDPHSAKIVFESGIKIVMAGLDVTEKARISKEDLEIIKDRGGLMGEFFYQITQSGLKRYFDQGLGYTYAPNDAVAILYLSNPDLFYGEKMFVQIVCDEGFSRGMSVADIRKHSDCIPNAFVLLDVDQKRFKEVFIEKLVG